MKIASVLVLLLCLAFLLILVILFSLSLSVSKQHDPFLSTYVFIVVKRSCRVAVFFIFNVIAITISRASLKPSTEDFDCFLCFPHLLYEADGGKYEATYEAYEYSDIEDSDEYHGYDGYEEDVDDDGSDDDVYSEDEQDKDLQRRIEEFIAQNHKQRREELIQDRLLRMAAGVATI